MKAGFFETDITPAIGMEKPGGYSKAFITAVHDPLKVRAGVFDDGATRAALVGIDTCVIPASVVAEARAAIERRSGIPGPNVLVGASHTHSGGPLFGFSAEDMKGASPLVRTLALDESTAVDLQYRRRVIDAIATAVCEADRRRETALGSVGRGQESEAAYNRRFRMKNGRAVTHPGKGNPDIIEPAGPIDPEVGVLAAWRSDGALLGCVVNYACHGTTIGGVGVSADWIYYLERTIQGVWGPVPVVFLNGACGDVTQVDNLSTSIPDFGEDAARKVGMRVGAEALKVLASTARGTLGPVAAARQTLKVPRRKPTAESVRRAKAVVRRGMKRKVKTTEWTFAKERVILDHLVRAEPAVDVEVQAVQVGPAVFLANPAEYFCRFGLEIKSGSPFPFTFVVELANGSAGYVPTPDALEPAGGGYETVLTGYSNLEPAAGEKIRAASVALSRRLTPGRTPMRARVKTAPTAWSYGVLGPELD